MIEYFNLDNINRSLAEVIRIASCPAFREYEGKMAIDIAAMENVDVTEVILKILTAPKRSSPPVPATPPTRKACSKRRFASSASRRRHARAAAPRSHPPATST